jgi:hypothetical protein
MPAAAPGPVQDRWCDTESRCVSLSCWVDQVVEHPEYTGKGQLIGVSPPLVRLPPEGPGGG